MSGMCPECVGNVSRGTRAPEPAAAPPPEREGPALSGAGPLPRSPRMGAPVVQLRKIPLTADQVASSTATGEQSLVVPTEGFTTARQ